MQLNTGDAYLIFKTIGIITFIVMGGHCLKRLNISGKKAYKITALATLLGFIGGRIWYLIQHILGRENYDITGWYRVWDNPGTVLYGWILACALFLHYLSKKENISFLKLFDAIVPGLLIGQALNRLGCAAAGCCYGKPLHAPWAIYNYSLGQYVHPVQLYEMIFDLALFGLIQAPSKKFEGRNTIYYFIGYPLARFIFEFFRGDNLPTLFGLTVPQISSIAILAALFLIWLTRPGSDR